MVNRKRKVESRQKEKQKARLPLLFACFNYATINEITAHIIIAGNNIPSINRFICINLAIRPLSYIIPACHIPTMLNANRTNVRFAMIFPPFRHKIKKTAFHQAAEIKNPKQTDGIGTCANAQRIINLSFWAYLALATAHKQIR